MLHHGLRLVLASQLLVRLAVLSVLRPSLPGFWGTILDSSSSPPPAHRAPSALPLSNTPAKPTPSPSRSTQLASLPLPLLQPAGHIQPDSFHDVSLTTSCPSPSSSQFHTWDIKTKVSVMACPGHSGPPAICQPHHPSPSSVTLSRFQCSPTLSFHQFL